MPPLPEVIKPDWIAQGAFWLIVGVTLTGAVFAVFLKQIVHNILGLIVSLFGVAGIFIYLNSEFLALMEILIYVGAICISFVFAIMLSEPMYKEKTKRNVFKTVLTGIVAGLIFWSFSTMILKTPWEAAAVKSGEWSVKAIGNLLLTRYMLAFELISFVLLVAIVGAIIIAGQGRKQRSSQ